MMHLLYIYLFDRMCHVDHMVLGIIYREQQQKLRQLGAVKCRITTQRVSVVRFGIKGCHCDNGSR